MPEYRLKPRLHLWRIGGIALALLLLPVPINAVLPSVDANTSRVELGSVEQGWTQELSWPDGTAMQCQEDDEAVLGAAWDCDGTSISTMVLEGSRDEAETLRRGIRTVTMVDVTGPVSVTRGVARLLETEDAVGMSVEGRDDHAGQTLVAVVTGPKRREYGLLLWTTLTEPAKLDRIANPMEEA
ncbi:hypothetical protein [Corynebacterium epidermidicanis]|uniref:Secreted protein n=1 Tax=Corynebacterium epidermidicanis TaxID=1050174 RepID=A0A0G3GND5_9CORY|nr:hypothetical protein [Corynebacterium epidermidicanis]AKK02085.1 hypothetical protein CEPID_00955 [Corynebacterium epidermidicanis]